MQKSYQCNKCKHFFPTPSYHAYHQKLCGATYSCSLCFRSYSSKKHLLQHYRRSGHSNTLSLNSIPKVENTPNRSPSKNTSIPSSYVARNPIPPSGSCGPLVLPLLILPVTVPNVSDVNVENLNSNVLGCLNMNFLYTSALSALRTLSTQIFPNPNVQVRYKLLDAFYCTLLLSNNQNSRDVHVSHCREFLTNSHLYEIFLIVKEVDV